MKQSSTFSCLRITLLLIAIVAFGLMQAAGNYFTITNLNTSDRKFKFTKNGAPAFVLNMEYSTDGGTTWTRWTDPTQWLTIPKGATYCFKGVNPKGLSNPDGVGYYYWDAYSGVAFSVSGDVMSLVCGDNDRSTIPSDYCFYRTFAQDTEWKAQMQNTGLVLSATTLKKGCYSYMFAGCASAGFATAPDFTVATNIPECAMMGMFQGCTKLTAVTALQHVTQIAAAGCDSMFVGCTALTQIMDMPNLKTIGSRGCAYMYTGCTALTAVPDMSVNDIADYGCYRTFYNCGKIATIGNLSAKTIAENGCNEMFHYNVSITSVGNLKAQSLSKYACYRMFANHQTSSTVYYDVPSITIDQAGDSSCIEMFSAKSAGYGKLNNIPTIKVGHVGKYAFYNMFLYQGRMINVDTIQMGVVEPYGCQQMFNYSGVQKIDLIQSPRIKSYGCANMFVNATALKTIDSIKTSVVEDHGFYQMCLNRTALTQLGGLEVDSLYDYACYQMFYGCSGLTSIPQQTPVRYIGNNACQQMFQSATKITAPMAMERLKRIAPYGCDQMYNSCSLLGSVPKMHVDYVDYAGCRRMFYYCPKIATIGSLTADTIANLGCSEMFYTKAGSPVACTLDTLEAKVLGDSACWNMFGGAMSNTKVSSVKLLKADKVGNYACMSMFDQCSKLTGVEEIRVKEIGAYGNKGMFTNCTTLTTLPDTLTAHLVKDGGCYQMFNKCAKISKLPVMIADTVARLGCYQMYTACNNSALVKVNDMKVDYAGDSAFFQMFNGYTYLTTIDTLRANTLGTAACQEMFNGCTKLNLIERIALKNVGERGCYRQFYGCANLNLVNNWTVDSIGTNGFKEKFSTCTYLVSVPSILPAKYIGDGGCESMFAEDKKNLVNAPQIAADYIGERGCYQMFQNCAALVTPPDKLSATHILREGCMRMFIGCAKLNKAPIINADSVGISGCQEMFSGCIALTTAPTIKFNYVNDYGCYMMFNGCAALTSAPDNLPAIHVGDYGYCKMFNGCKVLTKGPNIAATEVDRSGCEQMFLGCAALTKGPDALYAQVASPRCYYEMLNGCTKVQNIPYIHATTIADSACYNMCQNCSIAVTTQTKLHATTIGIRGCYQMFLKCIKLNHVMEMNLTSIGSYGCYYMYRQNLAQTSVPNMKCDKVGDHACTYMFEGCKGITTCGLLTATSIGTSGCENMFKNCSALTTFGGAKADKIGTQGCYGMLNGCPITTVPVLEARSIGNAGCKEMFANCTKLTSLPAQLPATTINQYGCASMFSGCTALQHGPEIMATTINSYGCQAMFNGCTAMTSADKIHVNIMTPYCCASMYKGCLNLITYPDTIPASVIGFHSCEEMFSGSSESQSNQMKLPKAPIIAAKQVGSYGCCKMFYNCRSLKVDKNMLINATQLATYCYDHMFYRCYAITDAPDLPAVVTPSYAYKNMFQSCTSLVGPPKISATTMGAYACNFMFDGCTDLDSVPELKAMNLDEGCYSSMFIRCTKLTKVPELPAKKMAPYCYQYMFDGCTALTTTPTLNSVELADFCYSYMFNGCKGITNTQDILPANVLANSCYMCMYKGCTALTTAPTLPARNWVGADGTVQKNCYREMFSGCTNLNCIRVFLREWETSTTSSTRQPYNWVSGVSKTGDFYRPLVLDSTTFSTHRIPYGTNNHWNLHEITLHTFNTNGGTWDGHDTISKQKAIPLGDMLYSMKEGCLFTGWNTMPDGSGKMLDWNNPPTGELTFYAQYKVADISVVDWESNALVIQTTNTMATQTDVQVQGVGNPIVTNTLAMCQMGADNPGLYSLSFDVSSVQAHAGNFLNLTFCNATDTMGVLIVKIPILINSNASTGSVHVKDSVDMWVTNGSTFTVDDDIILGDLYVSAGSKFVVAPNKTLHVRSITMRGGHIDKTGTYTFAYPQLVANGSIKKTSEHIYYEYLLNDKQFYNLYLPYAVNVGDITYLDGKAADFVLEQYNGEVRKVGYTGWEIAWNTATDKSPYPILNPNQGYTISATPETIRLEGSSTDTHRAYSYVRFPMLVDLTDGDMAVEHTLEVQGYGMTAGTLDAGIRPNDAGWNLVGNPYFANYGDIKGLINNGIGLLVLNGGEYEWQGSLRYVVMPANDGKSYTPELASNVNLAAFKNFFVQIGTGDALTFLLTNRAQNAQRRMLDKATEQMLGISLTGHGCKERVGLLIGEDYTEDYEINADLDKWMNKGMNFYAKIANYNLSVAAINENRASQPITLAINKAAEGNYTFDMDKGWTTDETKSLYLYDSYTGIYTDLTHDSYSCYLPEGDCLGRFFINVGEARITTNAGMTSDTNAPFVWSGKRVLMIGRLAENAEIKVYTMSGYCVVATTASDFLTLDMPQGIYTVRIYQNNTEYIIKSLVH